MNKYSLILNIPVDLWKSLVDLGRGHFGEKKYFFSGNFVKMLVQPLHIPMQPPIEKFGF